jgi:hypothetical protein
MQNALSNSTPPCDDPNVNIRARTIRKAFFGYQYVGVVCKTINPRPQPGSKDRTIELDKWMKNNCRGKVRVACSRTTMQSVRGQDNLVYSDWHLDHKFGTVGIYVGFQDERDYMLFLLKWAAT